MEPTLTTKNISELDIDQLINQALLSNNQEEEQEEPLRIANDEPSTRTEELPILDPSLLTTQNELPILDPSLLLSTTTSSATTTSKPVQELPKAPRLPKSKLIQTTQLNQAARQALDGVWLTLQAAADDQLKISRNLDRMFGELHASATPFKQDSLALIWPQCITNKTIKTLYDSRRSPTYFAIRRANLSFVAEYVLYAMPGEEAYGKNDIVFACEGFLPLVLDPEMVTETQSWKLFNELKVQIYIQRLDQSGQQEADTRVLPNLFVESLSSYSGLEVTKEIEEEFDKLSLETQQELIEAEANLELLMTHHPYQKFAIWALEFLHKCSDRLDIEEREYEQSLITTTTTTPGVTTTNNNKRKRNRQCPSSPITTNSIDVNRTDTVDHNSLQTDINVDGHQTEEEDEYNHEEEINSKGYNPYRLGRGKGPASAPRRRWTKEEYDLLLEEVRLHSNKYDCMAQIIKRHGKGGELSEIMKDQNNVSLKDKARNLTMEWQRHGYPEDKPWLKEAFARFSVKNLKRYRHSIDPTGADGEDSSSNPLHNNNNNNGGEDHVDINLDLNLDLNVNVDNSIGLSSGLNTQDLSLNTPDIDVLLNQNSSHLDPAFSSDSFPNIDAFDHNLIMSLLDPSSS
ncbi:hypothetical protein PSTG_07519 [Puccinia striiformis f. sp. tritici PST-78]|uniref:Myb-like domain-containing protein n=1 Tax=Puccinia striiformis f. sp. tritici PST-78 TaxID=1165861 RepID=A0A0L0VIU5_9BASI|nr:hypothetical protein PSTG_07519 [Puccinia striiformis f. sp. tritici PST-78]